MRSITLLFASVVAILLTLAMLFTAGWTRPPIVGTQTGYRGTGLNQITTPGAIQRLKAANALPEPVENAPPGGDRAVDTYKNVQVLTDLSTAQFNSVMAAMTVLN